MSVQVLYLLKGAGPKVWIHNGVTIEFILTLYILFKTRLTSWWTAMKFSSKRSKRRDPHQKCMTTSWDKWLTSYCLKTCSIYLTSACSPSGGFPNDRALCSVLFLTPIYHNFFKTTSDAINIYRRVTSSIIFCCQTDLWIATSKLKLPLAKVATSNLNR